MMSCARFILQWKLKSLFNLLNSWLNRDTLTFFFFFFIHPTWFDQVCSMAWLKSNSTPSHELRIEPRLLAFCNRDVTVVISHHTRFNEVNSNTIVTVHVSSDIPERFHIFYVNILCEYYVNWSRSLYTIQSN